VKTRLQKAGIAEDKIVVIPSGVDLSRFNPRVPSNRLRQELKLSSNILLVGIVGHLSPEKGHHLWIQAVPGILKEVPEAKFILVGEGSLRSALQDQISTLGLTSTVYVLGFRSDMPEILADLDILLSTSLSEGSPGSLKEAMAMGKPVIALDAGGVREIITDGVEGILLPYEAAEKKPSWEELVRGLRTAVAVLLKDGARRNRMGQAAIQKIQAYSMENMIEKTEAIYLEVLREKGITFL
ncbi:MAG: glycosyltransferase family 4 protein, partial [Nitrospira sp.]|nr:glycosyltransferase family 4 protein [Nitrospira sp.]